MSSKNTVPGSSQGFRSRIRRFSNKAKNMLKEPSDLGSVSSQQLLVAPAPSVNSPTPVPIAESSLAHNINISTSTLSPISAQPPSAEVSSLAICAPATPAGVNTSVEHVGRTVKPAKQDPENEEKRGQSWIKLEAALRALHQTSKIFPPLQSATNTLISCLDLVEVAARHRKDFDNLAVHLERLTKLLEGHLRESGSTSMSDCVTNAVESLKIEVGYIDAKRRQSVARGVMEANDDADELVQCFHRVEALFQRLQLDASLSTWSIENEHLANTRLEGLRPAKLASYNSTLATDINRRTCTERTRTAVLSRLNDWSHDANAAKVYWMNGMAGTGKTTIACTLSEALGKRKQLGASFFCSRTSPECRAARRIIPTIAYQLARYSLPFQFELCKVLGNDPDIGTRQVSQQFEHLLKEPLANVKEAFPNNVVVVVDALDECDDGGGIRAFLNELFRFAADLPIKLFLTSRPEPVVSDKILSQRIDARSVLHLHEIERSLVQADIELYLREELSFMSPPEPQIKQLAQLAGNLFIYAATAVRYVRPSNSSKSINPQTRIQAVLSIKSNSHKKYAELDALYRAILEAALNEEHLEVEEVEQVRLVLWTVVCAREPVTIRTLAALAGLGAGDTDAVLQFLRSVIHISETSSLVSTFHASFPDFIFTQERSQKFFCNESNHGHLLVQNCFEIMKAELRFNICQLETSFVLDESIKDLDKRVRSYISPPLSYACRYWGDYLSILAPMNLQVLLEDFLSNRLLFWMEVLNLSRSMTIGMLSLQKIQSWLLAGNPSPYERKLVADAVTFVTWFSVNPVSMSTPHIYISALSFCHKTSLVSSTYWGRMRGLIYVKGTAIEHRGLALASWITGGSVLSIALSPDGSLVAFGGGSISSTGQIGIINRHSGTFVVGPLSRHGDVVNSVAFSPDGTRVVSGSCDMTVCVWNAQDGALAAGPLKGHTRSVNSVAFSPDGMRIVSGSADYTIRVWSTEDGTLAAGPFMGHTESVNSVAFSPDGVYIASGSDDSTICMWNVEDGALAAGPFKGHTKPVTSVAFSPDGMHVGSGSEDMTICMWNAQDGTLAAAPFKGHTKPVHSIAFSPNNAYVVSGSRDQTICVWNTRDGTLVTSPFKGHTEPVCSVAFSPDGMHFFSGSSDKTIYMWNSQEETLAVGPFEGHTGAVVSVGFSPDGTRIISASPDRTICIWDAQDGTLATGPFKEHTEDVCSVAFSPDGMHIVSCAWDQTIFVRNTQDGTLAAGPFKGHIEWVHSVSFSSENMRIISGSRDKVIGVWNVQHNIPAGGLLQGHTRRINSAAFLPDGTCIASGSTDKIISPDDMYLVSGPSNDPISVWDAQDSTPSEGQFNRPAQLVSSVALSSDGTRIVSSSRDNTVCVWNTQDGTLVAGPFKGHTRRINSVALSPDGTCIVSGSDDCSVRVISLRDITLPAPVLDGEWDLELSGWVVNPNGQMLFWIPLDMRASLPNLRNPFVIGKTGTLHVDYTNVLLGEDWSQCYIGY